MPPVDGFESSRLEDLADTAEFREFLERNFPDLTPDLASGASRRTFMKLMGASFALAGLVGCRWPKERLAPFAHRPEGRLPGEPAQEAPALLFVRAREVRNDVDCPVHGDAYLPSK